MHRTLALPAIAFLSLTATTTAPAQGILPLPGTYRGATLASYFGSPCVGSTPGVFVESTTVVLQANGTFAGFAEGQNLCAGSASPDNEAISGFYAVGGDGYLSIATDGDLVERMILRPTGDVAIRGRDTADDEEAVLAIIVKLSSGKSDASLNGPYHVVRMAMSNAPAGLTSVTELGTITFDGAGNYDEVGNGHSVDPNGNSTNIGVFNSGVYSVDADGSLTVDGSQSGAISPDGEIFFWMDTQGPRAGLSGSIASLTVGIRQGTHPATIVGTYGLAGMDIESDEFPLNPDTLHTTSGDLTLAVSGNFGVSLFEVDTTRFQTTSGQGGAGGTYTLSPAGELALMFPGDPPFNTRISSAEDFVIGHSDEDEVVGMLLGMRRCLVEYGPFLAGTGGIAPRLGSSGGFPRLGNAAFGIAVSGGLGGAGGLLALSPERGNVPFRGGTLLLGPGLVTIPTMMSGPVGLPGIGSSITPIPVPAIPALLNLDVYFQVFLFDLGAPQNVSISQALWVTLCR